MVELPFMSVATDSFIADTNHMSPEEVGAYMRIACALWRHGGELAADEKQLARIAGATAGRWKKIGPVVTAAMIRRAGKIFDPRILVDLEKARARSKKNQASANLRWKHDKALKSRESCDANAMRPHMYSDSNHNQNQNKNKNYSEHHHQQQEPRPNGSQTASPADGADLRAGFLAPKSVPSAFVSTKDGKHAARIAEDLAARKARNAMRGKEIDDRMEHTELPMTSAATSVRQIEQSSPPESPPKAS